MEAVLEVGLERPGLSLRTPYKSGRLVWGRGGWNCKRRRAVRRLVEEQQSGRQATGTELTFRHESMGRKSDWIRR